MGRVQILCLRNSSLPRLLEEREGCCENEVCSRRSCEKENMGVYGSKKDGVLKPYTTGKEPSEERNPIDRDSFRKWMKSTEVGYKL